MSDLIPYNIKYVSSAQGFINMGSSCYFNSILQCILSCPVIFEVLDQNKDKEHIKKNPLAVELMKLSELALSGENIYDKCIPIWRNIIEISRRRKDNVKLDYGQQDAHEGLMLFLDVMDTIPEIKRLFEHRHKIQILCDQCKQWIVDKTETNLVFEVQPDLKTEQHEKFKDIDKFYNISMQLNDFLKKQNSYVDANFACPKCKSKEPKFKITTLTMVPEIIPVLLKKYGVKIVTPFPAKLEFIVSSGTKKIIYALVAQSEHSGNTLGGHYWAVCLRANINNDNQSKTLAWKFLNDSSVSDGQPGATVNSYVLFYNYIGIESI